MQGLQVLIGPSPGGMRPAGLPSGLRLAHAAYEEVRAERVVFCEDESFAKRWKDQLRGLAPAFAGPKPAADVLDADKPLLVLSASGFPRLGALAPALERLAGAANGRPARWQTQGRPAAVYFPKAGSAMAGSVCDTARLALDRSDASSLELEGWLPAF